MHHFIYLYTDYNEEAYASVCLGVKECIIQFIHLMRPNYLAILMRFQRGDQILIKQHSLSNHVTVQHNSYDI